MKEHITILGRLVSVECADLPSWQAKDINTKIFAAAGLLNKAVLSQEEVQAISQIDSLVITASYKDYLGETSPRGMTLSVDYIQSCSASWLASLIGHEGQHALNAGKYKGDDRWRNEQSAGTLQLGIGKKIGFTPGEIVYMENWIDAKNWVAMQQHMVQGFRL